MSRSPHDALGAAVVVLMVLTSVMLLALFTRTPPHPPLEVTPFALAPFLGASLALGAAALWQVQARSGLWLSLAFAATALVSYGPQKYLDPAFTRIWPAVILAQAAIATIAYLAFRTPPHSG
ncbi:MAG: hypothetical protein AAGF86_04265 [Pseudomonadota bacterium]